MKKAISISLVFILSSFIIFAVSKRTSPETNYADCLVKVASKWGAPCEKCVEYKNNKRVYDDTYTVYLKNNCGEKVEAKCCVQEADKKWNCTAVKTVNPNDTLIHYACKGTGKYLKWVKKACDSEITFPSDEEINAQFKE